MKMITAIVQPFMLTKVMHALEEIAEFPGMTITDARGFGREKQLHEDQPHQRSEDLVEHVKKTRIDIVARDEMVDEIVKVLLGAAHTGNRGDGKIFVWTVERSLRIQTGEAGDAAL